MNFLDFPKDFIWGTATAAFQIEGASKEDGRSPSIWDTFCSQKGNIINSDTGEIACDHYHHYKEDIELMAKLGIKSYRFSLSWSRIVPLSNEKINPKGVDFYMKIIDCLLLNKIEPLITLYHWDLPQYLQDKGGWENRETAYAFKRYAIFCFSIFKNKVKKWITINEPYTTLSAGYIDGDHAPGVKDINRALVVGHHQLLAHGLAVKEIKKISPSSEIGISLNLYVPRPAILSKENIKIANQEADIPSRFFLNPLYGRPYPQGLTKKYPTLLSSIKKEDFTIIKAPCDFIGINYYREKTIQVNKNSEKGFSFIPTTLEKTDMGWEIVPEGLYRLLQWLKANYPIDNILITENGCACKDLIVNNRCHDLQRINYLKDHLYYCQKATEDGIPLKGYYVWSFLDNFEWEFGYSKRFGLVYVDYQTQKRIAKDSFYFFQSIISKPKI